MVTTTSVMVSSTDEDGVITVTTSQTQPPVSTNNYTALDNFYALTHNFYRLFPIKA